MMAKKIDVKLLLEFRQANLSQRAIASASPQQMRHGDDSDKTEGNDLPQHRYVRPAPQPEKD